MPTVRTYASPAEYWDEVGPQLLADEARYSLAIGLAQRFIDDRWEPEGEDAPAGSILASVWHADGQFDLAAWCGPPHSLSVTGGTREGLAALLETIHGRSGSPAACFGPTESIEHVAALDGRDFHVEMDQGAFVLDAVVRNGALPNVDVVASTGDHQALLERWCRGFAVDAGLIPEDSDEPLDTPPLSTRHRFLALNSAGEPVSMAAITRETPSSANISWVYTPRHLRGQGYASALVAQLSQQALVRGKSFCTLYTDLLNPTSNRIYQAIGYRRVGSFRHVRFRS